MRSARWAALGLACALLAGCSTLQQEGDDMAARVADNSLVTALDDAIASSGAKTPEERAVAAEQWLSDPDPSMMDGRGGAWVVLERDGQTIRLAMYYWWESGSFFPPDQGKAVWGLACRSYDATKEVTVQEIECPEGTPEQP